MQRPPCWYRRFTFLRAAGACLLAAGLVWLNGCKKDSPTPPPTPTPAKSEVNDLRALPYAGSAPKNANDQSGVVQHDPKRSFPGYSLYTMQMLSRAELIDPEGIVIRTWSHSPSRQWERCTLLPGGDVLVVGSEEGRLPDGSPLEGIADDARYVLRLAWNGELIWKKKLTAHHDITLMPDGKLLALTFERRSVPQIHPNIPVRDDHLTLLDTNGEVLSSQSMLEMIGPHGDMFPLIEMRPTRLGGPPWVDLFHSNSVERMRHEGLFSRHTIYEPQNVLVCFRHQDRIAVFDLSQKRVIWAWGQDELDGPHDAQVLESGNILVFDNGLHRGWSRVIELNPINQKIVWQYKADPPESFHTRSKGSAQRLPNGNTLMADSDNGRAFEVTPEGEIVWEFLCPHDVSPDRRAAIVRIRRFSHEYIESIIDAREE